MRYRAAASGVALVKICSMYLFCLFMLCKWSFTQSGSVIPSSVDVAMMQ